MYVSDIELHDYSYLKKLGNSYKLIKCNSVRKRGYESLEQHSDVIVTRACRRKGYHLEFITAIDKVTHVDYSSPGVCNSKIMESSNDSKLMNNICRSRNKILEYVLCNDFDYFVTLTLSPDLFERTNLCDFIKKLRIFIKHYNSRKSACIKYLFIPEQHKDGCWHMHGFIMGLPDDRLKEFQLNGDKPLPPYITSKLRQGYKLFYFPDFEEKFGYNIFEPIRNKKASALYMCKYLTKDLSRNVRELGNHLYYCSKGLKKAEIVKEGQFLDSSFQFDFQNDYGGQSFYDELSDDDLLDLMNKIGSAPVSLDERRNGYRLNDGFNVFLDYDTGEIIGNIPDYMNKFTESEVL